MYRMLIALLIASTSFAMQQPARVYDAEKTDALQKILDTSNEFGWDESEIQNLILAGADPNITTSNTILGRTLLSANFLDPQLAVKRQGFSSWLLQNGADPNKWYFEGPLHKACEYGLIATVTELIAQKANVTAKTNKGVSPLMCAVSHVFPGIVETLLKAGAQGDIDFLDANGNTPIRFINEQLAAKGHTDLDKEKFQRILNLLKSYQ